jgi:predicted flap endonuclease-1-like 5' DNA nuclease
MEHLTFELVLWMLLAFFIGCILGCLLRQSLSRRREEATTETVGLAAASPSAADEAALAEATTLPDAPVVVVEEASELAALDALAASANRAKASEQPQIAPTAPETRAGAGEAPSPQPAPAPAASRSKRPQGLAAPRGDTPDNLQRISGIGPKLEKTLQDLGFFHYDQIAAWDQTEVDWINEHLRFRGRVEREQWIEQARLLAEGEEERFGQVYGARALHEEGDAGAGQRGRRGQGTGKS